ncbi:MAG: galactokinase [Lachnospiraceae bacterium]|nr:galactokinase [Lachnospiraceae bacterium]
MKCEELLDAICLDRLNDKFITLYGNNEETIKVQKERYVNAIKSFMTLYPKSEEISVFSAPGRTEVCGNHTDHQNGCVLAAAVNLDAIAIVSFHNDHVIRIQSVGYEQEFIELDHLNMHPEEKGTSRSLIRGMVSQFHDMGVEVGGFNAFITSDVLSGSGLSSSAAFEVLIGNIIDCHYHGAQAGAVKIAKMGQFAENKYFGKESGLMDQMVSSVGGFVFIDFEDTTNPVIEKHNCDFEEGGLKLIITDTKGSHADLTDDYVSIPSEMKLVAAQFGKSVLREVDEEQFYQSLPRLRNVCSDRAILRAAHFFGDNARVRKETDALDKKDFSSFLKLVCESGKSSAELLQNLYSTKKPIEQGIPLALMASKNLLKDCGAFRVHGGGFAGTIQAFVPLNLVKEYEKAMESLFGEGCCYILNIRPVGGYQVV